MDRNTILMLLAITWLFFGIIGWGIGKSRKLGAQGFLWGFSMGPLGLIIITIMRGQVLPDKAAKHLLDNFHLLIPREPPAPVRPSGLIRVCREEQELGEWTITEIKRYLNGGSLLQFDMYFDAEGGAWLPLSEHPWI